MNTLRPATKPRRELSISLIDERGGVHRLQFWMEDGAEAEFWTQYMEQLVSVVRVQSQLYGHKVEHAGFYIVGENGERNTTE